MGTLPSALQTSISHFYTKLPTMAGPVEQQIHRDPALFYWILLPITVVMVLTGILRHYLSTLLQSTPKKQALGKMREQRSLMHAQMLRANHQQISKSAFERRKDVFITGAKEGLYLQDGRHERQCDHDGAAESYHGLDQCFLLRLRHHETAFPAHTPIQADASSGRGHSGSGREMGIQSSWYFLTLFGLQPVYNFILGSNNAASQMAQQMQQQQMGANPMGGAEDPNKIFLSEAENLEVVEHRYILEGVEDRLLESLSAQGIV